MRNIKWVEKQTTSDQEFICPSCHGLVSVGNKSNSCEFCYKDFKPEELHLLILPKAFPLPCEHPGINNTTGKCIACGLNLDELNKIN